MKKVVLALTLLVSTAAYSMSRAKEVPAEKGMIRLTAEYPFTNAWHGATFIADNVSDAAVGSYHIGAKAVVDAYKATSGYVTNAWKAGYGTAAMKLGVAPLALLAAIGVMTDPVEKPKSE